MKVKTPKYIGRTSEQDPDKRLILTQKSHVEQNYLVHVKLERLAPKSLLAAVDLIAERFKNFKPSNKKIVRPKAWGDSHLFELSLYDAHFGKLAWAAETRSPDYDLKIAVSVYRDAVNELLDRASHYKIDRFLFPIGNDFLHIDSNKNETTNGTRVDTDGRLGKILDAGIWATIEAIERCREVAPIDVIYVGGNHDANTSLMLSKVIQHRFHDCKDVTVDSSPAKRKFYLYGENGIMLTHGDKISHRDLPITMAAEDREKWGKTSYSEIHTGHYHKVKEVYFTGADTYGGGVVVRTLPSLSAPDAWHADHGWTRTMRSAVGFMWGKKPGIEAYFATNVK